MDKLEKHRRLIKLSMAQISSRVEEELKKPPSQEIIDAVESELAEFTELKSKFESIQESLLQHIDELEKGEMEKAEIEWVNMNDGVSVKHAKMRSQLQRLRSDLSATTSRDSILNSSREENPSPAELQVKLPKIDLPKFDGDIRNFIDFKNLVHSNPNISNVQKLYYLKSSMIGKAEEIVKDFGITDQAYGEAWSSFCNRYDNKRSIIRAHLNDLFALPKLKNETGIRKMLDDINRITRGLKILNEDTGNWSTVLSYWLLSRVDEITKKDFENKFTDTTKFPTYKEVYSFLERRALTVDEREHFDCVIKEPDKSSRPVAKKSMSATKSSLFRCFLCSGSHYLSDCASFLKKTPTERFNFCKESKLCICCFSNKHHVSNCVGRKCRECSKSHHSLLHREGPFNNSSAMEGNSAATTDKTKPESNQQNNKQITSNSACFLSSVSEKLVLLPTAVVKVHVKGQRPVLVRILFDRGSQISFISDSLVRKLKIPTHRFEKGSSVSGIGDTIIVSTHYCEFVITSRISSFSLQIEADVISNISYSPPVERLKKLKGEHYSRVFADDQSEGDKVDIILGAEYIEGCLEDDSSNAGTIKLRNSKFGFIISGALDDASTVMSSVRSRNLSTLNIDEALKRFWEVEKASVNETSDSELDSCRAHFNETYSRGSDGRFIVRLPVKQDISLLSNTRMRAEQAMKRVELKLPPEIRFEYHRFMNEYHELGHMEKVPESELPLAHSYLIPHHAVLRPSSSTTKLRVVFNASARVKECGLSLNDILMKGPVVPAELFDTFVQFRSYAVAFISDIEKMYRQVLIDHRDRNLQCILWRNSPTEKMIIYRLKTVIYGTTTASFIATNCLTVLGCELAITNPTAGTVLMNNFYMDDLLADASSIGETVELIEAVNSKLLSAGFCLRKFASNSVEVLDSLDPDLVQTSEQILLDNDASVSTLGLNWVPTNDSIGVLVKATDLPKVIIKRVILSVISRQFDPLGICAPVLIRGTLMLQDLRREGVLWDQCVPPELDEKFRRYCADLTLLNSFSIERYYRSFFNSNKKYLIGFSDTSLKAYCAVAQCNETRKNRS